MDSVISIDSYPSTDFGVLEGKVIRIGSDALEPDPQEQRRLWITLAAQAQGPLEQARQVGMSLTANIKLRKVSCLHLLLGEFQDKAESLQRL